MNRALPPVLIDAIRDGAHPRDLSERGERAVWSALVRTAASASQRGWTFPEWAELVTDPRSNLGKQAQLRRGRAPRTAASFAGQLRSAWQRAEKWLAEQPAPVSPVDVYDKVAALRRRLVVADLPAELVLVLGYACDVAERNSTDRPALPRREVAAGTGLNERTVRTALERLCDRGLLQLDVRGRPGLGAKRRANLYRLADAAVIPIPVPVNRSMGRLQQVYGTPPTSTVGTGNRSMGPPGVPEEDGMVELTLTIKHRDPVVIAQTLHALQAQSDVEIEHGPPAPAALPDNVTALRREGSGT